MIMRNELAARVFVSATCVLFWSGIVSQTRAETGITNTITGTTVNSPSTYTVGNSGPFNALIITNAGVLKVTGDGIIGNSANAMSNNVWVTGAGSLWTNSGDLYVGFTGSFNQLTILNGGKVINTNYSYIGYNSTAGNNSILVTGTGSVWNTRLLYMGLLGSSNTLTITTGGMVSSFVGYVGNGSSGSNTANNSVLVTGPGSVWNSSFLTVGDWGSNNNMTIANGGRVIDVEGYIGYDQGGSNNSVLVTGPGSVWSNSGRFMVGYAGAGNSLVISNGGTVFSSTGYIGNLRRAATNNSVLVTGTGSVWNSSGSIYVGYYASNNNLKILNGGTVLASNVVIGFSNSTGNAMTIAGGNIYATNSTATGFLDVHYGSMTLNSGTVVVNRLYLTNNASSVMTFSAGLLRSGGTTVSNGTAFVVGDGIQTATYDMNGGTHSFANGLSISTNGNLIGIGDIIAGSATNFGIIAPGHSAGLLTFSGDLTLQDSSILNFEIGGASTNDNDRVWVGGLLRIGGLLNMVLTNDYTGNAGDTFDLFNFGTVTGTFSQTNLPTLGAGMAWNTDHLYTLGEISIVPEPSTWALFVLGIGGLATRQHRGLLRRHGGKRLQE